MRANCPAQRQSGGFSVSDAPSSISPAHLLRQGTCGLFEEMVHRESRPESSTTEFSLLVQQTKKPCTKSSESRSSERDLGVLTATFSAGILWLSTNHLVSYYHGSSGHATLLVGESVARCLAGSISPRWALRMPWTRVSSRDTFVSAPRRDTAWGPKWIESRCGRSLISNAKYRAVDAT